jgi:hypothetical protein
MNLDDIIERLYMDYSGLELAEAIARYRKRVELAKKEAEELELLKTLTEKHSGVETSGPDITAIQSNENELPPPKRRRRVG